MASAPATWLDENSSFRVFEDITTIEASHQNCGISASRGGLYREVPASRDDNEQRDGISTYKESHVTKLLRKKKRSFNENTATFKVQKLREAYPASRDKRWKGSALTHEHLSTQKPRQSQLASAIHIRPTLFAETLIFVEWLQEECQEDGQQTRRALLDGLRCCQQIKRLLDLTSTNIENVLDHGLDSALKAPFRADDGAFGNPLIEGFRNKDIAHLRNAMNLLDLFSG